MTYPTPTPQPSADSIRASYGFVGTMANSIPELRNILDQAVREQWTGDRFIMAVSATNWYRTNQDAAREWVTLQAVDPATAEQKLWTSRNEINVLTNNLGIPLNGDQEGEIAMWRILNPNASADVLQAHIARNYFDQNMDWTQLGGQAAALAGQIQEIGRAYGWDDYTHYDSSRNWLGQIMRGEDTIDGFKRKMIDYAKIRYPGLHDQLLSGMTVQEIAQPYMDVYSQILEVPQTSINWYEDDQMNRALQYRKEGGNEQANGTMPIYEFEKQLRDDPRWSKTDNAMDSVAGIVDKIGTDWGFIGR